MNADVRIGNALASERIFTTVDGSDGPQCSLAIFLWRFDRKCHHRLCIGSLQIELRSDGIDVPAIGRGQFELPFNWSSRRGHTHWNRFCLIRGKHQHAVREVRENRRRNDQRLSQFTRHRIHRAIPRVDNVTKFLPANLQRYLHRKMRRVFRQADQFLIIDRKGAERSRLTKPVGLRIRRVLRNLARQIFRDELVRRKRRINSRRVAGKRKSHFLQRNGNIATVNCFQLDGCALPRCDVLVGRRSFHMQPQTRGDDPIQLCFLLRDPTVILKATQRLPELQ